MADRLYGHTGQAPFPSATAAASSSLSNVYSSSRSLSDYTSARYLASDAHVSNLASKYYVSSEPRTSMYLNQNDPSSSSVSRIASRPSHCLSQSSLLDADAVAARYLGSDTLASDLASRYSATTDRRTSTYLNQSDVSRFPVSEIASRTPPYLSKYSWLGSDVESSRCRESVSLASDLTRKYSAITDGSTSMYFNHNDAPRFSVSEITLRTPHYPSQSSFCGAVVEASVDPVAGTKRSSDLLHSTILGSHNTIGRSEDWYTTNSLAKRTRFESTSNFPLYLQKPGEKDLLTRSYGFGDSCKVDHPSWVPEGGIPGCKEVPKIVTDEALPERPGKSYSPVGASSGSTAYPQRPGSTMYPQRPGEPACDHYMRKGTCKYWMKCKFHHPVVRPNPSTNHATLQNVKLTLAGYPKREGIIMCPQYLKSGSCKYGANCKYNHPSPREVIAKALQGITSSTDSDEEDDG